MLKIPPFKNLFALVFICFALSAQSQEMGDDEKKSLEKGGIKNAFQGVKEPGLNLPPEKMNWWQDQKFGMFIHWGLYSIPARGEWVAFNEKIPAEQYAKLADSLNPQNFSPKEWVDVAKQAGMKYMVMVTRHHDGFSLWNSPGSYGNFTSWKAAAHRDFVKEYTDAARKAGMHVGLYYSPLDWRFPGYFNPKGLPQNAALLKKQTYDQVEELMKGYGKIEILWYDGSWLAHKGHDADAAWFWEPLKLNRMVRKYQPNIVINPRSGMVGDFQTNEGSAPVAGKILNFPWEKSLSLNPPEWGYKKEDKLMPLKAIIDMLVNTVDRGGNMCLNVGPDPEGHIPATHIQRLKEVGQWMKENGESIYGTRPGPFEPVDGYYGATHKGNKIYIHLLAKQSDTLQLPAIEKKVNKCYTIKGNTIHFTQNANGVALQLATAKLDPVVTTLILETK